MSELSGKIGGIFYAASYTSSAPGTQVAGFFNWTINWVSDPLETTDFADSGLRTYIHGLKGWTGSADQHWLTTEPLSSWGAVGSTYRIRLFTEYSAAPSASNTVYYYEGRALISGIDTNTPVDALVTQAVTFTGTLTLTYTTSSTAW